MIYVAYVKDARSGLADGAVEIRFDMPSCRLGNWFDVLHSAVEKALMLSRFDGDELRILCHSYNHYISPYCLHRNMHAMAQPGQSSIPSPSYPCSCHPMPKC
jgi:hypothetical protein